MQGLKKILLILFLLIINVNLFSNNTGELLKAQQQLGTRGEVYYRFSVNNLDDVGILTDIVSIDKIDGNEIYAYANKKEFEEFLKRNFYYEVLTPPSLACPPPAMSDYADVKFPLIDWTKYPTYSGYQNIMSQLQSTYPDKVKCQTIGTSVKNRNLIMANVTSNVGTAAMKAGFLMHAGINGDEVLAVMMMMRLIDWLCSNYGKDPRATRILDSMELWISPMVNPDGTYAGGDNSVTGAIRYNSNNVDLNRDYTRLPGLGTSPTPQKETKTYMDFEKLHLFTMGIGWHAGTEGISYPWSCVARQHVDDAWYMYVSRKFADTVQKNGPSGFFDDINNGAGQGYIHLYPATGTEKDYLVYFHHNRSNCFESSAEKILPESKLEAHWGYYLNPTLTYIQQALNGIRGTVTDSITGQGIKAKVWVENHDKNEDSSFVYSYMPFGNYYRPIIQGTYSVTYSSPGYSSKTINNISVQNDKATIVNVKLYGGTNTTVAQSFKTMPISIISHNGGVKIQCGNVKGAVKAAIYSIQGKLITMLNSQSGMEHTTLLWNGLNDNARKVGKGCYVLHIQSTEGSLAQPFMFSN